MAAPSRATRRPSPQRLPSCTNASVNIVFSVAFFIFMYKYLPLLAATQIKKVLTGNGEAVVNIRPQQAGRYDFFDDFHAGTTKGVLVVK